MWHDKWRGSRSSNTSSMSVGKLVAHRIRQVQRISLTSLSVGPRRFSWEEFRSISATSHPPRARCFAAHALYGSSTVTTFSCLRTASRRLLQRPYFLSKAQQHCTYQYASGSSILPRRHQDVSIHSSPRASTTTFLYLAGS